MKYLLIILVISALVFADTNGPYPASELETPLFPKAKSMNVGETLVYIDPSTFKFTTKSTMKDLLNGMDRYHKQIFVHPQPNTAFSQNDIFVPSLEITVDDETAKLQQDVDESYKLVIKNDGTPSTLSAPTVFGVYHGLESFSQLVQYNYAQKKYLVNKTPITIEDKPFASYRGLLIDTSRHYLAIDVIKRVIQSLTYAKMNLLHWHMVDEQSIPVQSKNYPTFWDAAYSRYERYTQVEIADVVEYARQRGVRVMVEYDVPGHGASWCKGLPEICPSATCLSPLDLTKDFTYQFLDGFFSEMTGRKTNEGLFPETLFHLGGDEVDLGCYTKEKHIADWLKERGMSDTDGYLYIVNKTQHIIMEQGRDPVNWEEIWRHFGTKLDKRTIVHAWLTRDAFVEAANAGYRTILSNYQVWYLDYLDTAWTTFYDNSLTNGINAENYKYIMGGEVCMWAETIDVSDLFQTVWPRAAAAAERLWSNPATREADTENRLKWFRCYLIKQGVEAAPVMNSRARQNPPHQDSCYIQ